MYFIDFHKLILHIMATHRSYSIALIRMASFVRTAALILNHFKLCTNSGLTRTGLDLIGLISIRTLHQSIRVPGPVNKMRPYDSESSDSSDTTAELEVLVPLKTRNRSLGLSKKKSPSSSGQTFSPSSTSPPLDSATPGPSGVSTSRSLHHLTPRSRGPEQISRLACTIRYLWHLLRQHEKTDNSNSGFVRFWATRYGTLVDNSNGGTFNSSTDLQRPTPNMSTSTSEDLRSLTVEPPSDDDSAEMYSDPIASEEQDPQTPDDLNSSLYDQQTSVKEKSDADNEKPHFIESERSKISRKVTDEVNQLITSLGQIYIQNEEESDDGMTVDYSEPVASTSKEPWPSTENKRKQKKERPHFRAEDSRRGVICEAIRILVPTDKVGRIVGKGGRQIKEIEKKTGTNITVESRKSDKPSTVVTVRGSRDAIDAAERMIRDLIRNYKKSEIGEH